MSQWFQGQSLLHVKINNSILFNMEYNLRGVNSLDVFFCPFVLFKRWKVLALCSFIV